MQKKSEKIDKLKTVLEITEILIAVLIMLCFCVAMTIPSETMRGFEKLFHFLMLISIIYGIIASIIKYRRINKMVLLFTVLYFICRVISYKQNGLTINYGGAFMLQVFYLIGINRDLFGGKRKVTAALYTFLVFDLMAIAICYYNYLFNHEKVALLVEKYAEEGMEPQTSLFQNPNYAGMMAGAAIVLCGAMILNRGIKNRLSVLFLLPALLVNAAVLFAGTTCRSAQTAIIITALAVLVVQLIKRTDSVKNIIGVALLACSLTLIPLHALVFWGDNDQYLGSFSPVEWELDTLSSGRYAIWKMVILSMKGSELFGYGNSVVAWDKRKELYDNTPADRKTDFYKYSLALKRQHNGYLSVVNEAGYLGAVFLLSLLLGRTRKLKGRFRDGQWEKMLLVYLFWINLFEAKFLLQIFFSGLLIMILLLPPEDEQTD